MYIKKMKIQEGIYRVEDTFEEVTLIHSEKNSCGKSTYLRCLFYGLGYPIPQMKGFDYAQITTEICLEEKGKEFLIVRRLNSLTVICQENQAEIIFSLPHEHNAFLGYIFNSEKQKVLNNLLGIMYIDQDKGWSLLNRGTVIGRIKFSIEELLAGLADIDCDKLLDKKRVLQDNVDKYNAMLDINELSEEVYTNNGEIFITDVEKELSASIALIDLKVRDIKKKIQTLDHTIRQEASFWAFVDALGLKVRHGEELIEVNRDNIVNALEPTEYLLARKNLLISDMNALLNQRAKLQNQLGNYYAANTELTAFFGDTQETILNRQLAAFSFDRDAISKLLDKAQKDLKSVNKEIQTALKNNNIYIQKIYDYVKKYSQILKIDDKIDNRKNYIFTTDLKSFSGATLQKLVFAFKIAFLKVIEEVLETKLVIVMDSPRGKELDDENLSLIMDIVKNELSDNQVFIASIYDDFAYDKKIVLKKRAIEDRA